MSVALLVASLLAVVAVAYRYRLAPRVLGLLVAGVVGVYWVLTYDPFPPLRPVVSSPFALTDRAHQLSRLSASMSAIPMCTEWAPLTPEYAPLTNCHLPDAESARRRLLFSYGVEACKFFHGGCIDQECLSHLQANEAKIMGLACGDADDTGVRGEIVPDDSDEFDVTENLVLIDWRVFLILIIVTTIYTSRKHVLTSL